MTTTTQRVQAVYDDYLNSPLPTEQRMAWLMKKHELSKRGLQRALWGKTPEKNEPA